MTERERVAERETDGRRVTFRNQGSVIEVETLVSEKGESVVWGAGGGEKWG
jgi:hypothetical protein